MLHDVEEEEKVFHLCHCSKKLAVEFGLINTAPGTQLQIIKDQRVCEDFHTSTKFISKILGRVIMVRDVNQFHHFEDGICSHMDYIVDAIVCICHSLHQVHFVCSMSSGIFTPPKLNTVIRCGTTGKVTMELPRSFDFPASTNLYHVGLVPLSHLWS